MTKPPKPTIQKEDPDVDSMLNQVWGSIIGNDEPTSIFRYGNVAVRVNPLTGGIEVFTPPTFIPLVTRHVDWIDAKGNAARPTERDINILPSNAIPEVPELRGLIRVPGFAAGGHLVSTPGYDPRSGLYLTGTDARVEVPTKPSPSDVSRAKIWLLTFLIGHFPFADLASRANALALVLLPFVRDMIDGPTPIHLVEKPQPRTGGTLLVKWACAVGNGAEPTMIAAPGDDEEYRKLLLAHLIQGAGVLSIDNIRVVRSPALCAAVTARTFEGRVLGKTKMVSVPVRCVFVMSGNNPVLSDEVAKRCIAIRLDARHPDPERRPGIVGQVWEIGSRVRGHLNQTWDFHPIESLRGAARRNLVWSALVLCQNWIAAGQPLGRAVPKKGGFEEYTRVMGSLLAHNDILGFLENQATFEVRSNPEAAEEGEFISEWWLRTKGAEKQTREIAKWASGTLLSLLVNLEGRPLDTKVGQILTSWEGREFHLPDGAGRVKVTKLAKLHGRQLWAFTRVGKPEARPAARTAAPGAQVHPGEEEFPC